MWLSQQDFRVAIFIQLPIISSVIRSTATSIPESAVAETGAKSGVYALPEIQVKLLNGTLLEAEPNSPLVFPREIAQVELSCTADYPVKWEYIVKNKTVPMIDNVYRRLVRKTSRSFGKGINSPRGSRFMSFITLYDLLESQSGKYLCRQYNERLENNSYAISSYFDIFIPGNSTFTTINNLEFTNKSTPFVNIHCPISDPSLHVRLYKLNEKHFNLTGEVIWKPIYSNYEPSEGFRLFSGLGRELLGTYNCTADNGASVLSIAADISHQNLYNTSTNLIDPCLENPKFVQYLKSQRIECHCKDSYGLFMNDNFEFENRQAACTKDGVMRELQFCSDWRLEEFFDSNPAVESQDVCFRDPITQADGNSGSKPSLKVKGETFPSGDAERNFSFTKFTITYNGFVDWAGDFVLAICREESCQLSHTNDSSTDLEYIEIETTKTQYFPMAHQQAVWENVIVNGTDVKRVYVFQAHSLSYEWFPYSTANIDWDTLKGESDMLNSGQKLVTNSVVFGFVLFLLIRSCCS